MSIELPIGIEEQLRSLAATQGRNVVALVEEAVRQYIEAAAITDVEADEVANTQAALIVELPNISDWKASGA